jgi:type II secretory pathway pseudopilin PulG
MSITSLLNDSGDGSHAKIPLPSLSVHSRAPSSTPSCDSTPSLSPQTPQLSRSSSSDSRAFSTPSPLTPGFNSFDQAAAQHQQHALSAPRSSLGRQSQHQQRYFLHSHTPAKMDDQTASMYPPVPDVSGSTPQAYPMPPQMMLQQHQQAQPPPPLAQVLPQQQSQQRPQSSQDFRASVSPASEQPSRVSTASAQSNQKSQKKNQYPCPMAKQVGCTDYFTTSGHAARHAKKHTGKKDAFCPECNKAFTRKDNMEQHRRTHQNGRGASRSSNDDSKVKKATKAPTKKAVVRSESALEAAVDQQLAEQARAVQAQQAVQVIEHAQAQAQAQTQQLPPPLPVDQMMLAGSGPYFLTSMDSGPIPSLPLAMPDLNGRPPLHRASFASSLDYVPPTAPMIDPETLHYSYPSPGLSNGLNSLALAASEHIRQRSFASKQQSRSPSQDQSTP